MEGITQPLNIIFSYITNLLRFSAKLYGHHNVVYESISIMCYLGKGVSYYKSKMLFQNVNIINIKH